MSEAGPGRNECHYIIQRRTRHNVTWYAAGIPGCACPNRADPKRAPVSAAADLAPAKPWMTGSPDD